MSDQPPPSAFPLPTPVVPVAATRDEPSWAKTVISAMALLIFAAAFVIAYLTKTGLELMQGAAVTMGGAVVNYWLGSSAGSDKKTNMLNAKVPTP